MTAAARRRPPPGPRRGAGPRLPAAAAVLAMLLPAPAAAAEEAMRVADLGPMPSRLACLEAAARVLDAYIADIGGYATSGDPENPEEWAIYGWELEPGNNDVVIACPTVAGQVNALLTVHASGEGAAGNADSVAERIRDLWTRLR